MNGEVTYLMRQVQKDVLHERIRQNHKWGMQRHPMAYWLVILMEEVGEAAQAVQREHGQGKETDAANLYEELIHTAAVALAAAEQVREGIENAKIAQGSANKGTQTD